MSRTSRLVEIDKILGSAPTTAPALNDVTRSAYEDVRKQILASQRNEAEATRKCKKALRLIDSGRSADGVRLAVSALDDDPECVHALVVASAGLDYLGLLPPALTFMQEALRIAPENPLIPAVLADIAKRNGDLDNAEKLARIATSVDPLNWRTAATLALILRDQMRFDEAIEILRTHILTFPTEPILWNALAAVMIEYGDADNAATFAHEALRLSPGHTEAYHNLGVALIDEGEFEEAYSCFVKASSGRGMANHRANSGLSLAHALLGSGRIAEGWPAYDIRVQPGVGLIEFATAAPRWAGEDLAGKRLLLIGEQGLGDEIMFLSAATDAQRALGPDGRMAIACERRLVDLFARSFGAEAMQHFTVKGNGRPLRSVPGVDWSSFDVWAPVGDLARYFRPSIDDFSKTVPFLKPDETRAAQFKDQRKAFGDGLVVGIAWRSLLMNFQRKRFFADIDDWAPVLRTPGVTFVSLQPGDTEQEEERIAQQFGVRLRKFEDLDVRADLDRIAAASTALDLVIAPMNASSNLAAGVGAPVWFTAGHKDWSMLGADAVPWYPWSRLFLAPRRGAWSELYARVAGDLAALVQDR
jgi:tetratricopeptide (TPR) repeat protein